jgi:Ser/Thr protein kinase RdoA (MazF antagonist)
MLILPLTPETGAEALRAACQQMGLDADGAELIRIGSNAVYRLRKPVIVRIAPSSAAAANARLQVAVAHWLAGHEYPATRALSVEQPIEVEERVATFWESVSEREEYAPIDQVAELIRQLHQLAAPTTFALPKTRPFDRARDRLDRIVGTLAADLDYLVERLGKLEQEYDTLEFALPIGPIHGDANVGNVILDRDGRPVLSDFDSFACGPRE